MSFLRGEVGHGSGQGMAGTKRVIIDVNPIVFRRNYDILTSIIAQLLTSRPFPDLCSRDLV